MNRTNPPSDTSSTGCSLERPTAVRGWASENYAVDDEPAVIINPQATALTLLSWGIGQLRQCNVLLDAVGSRVESQELDVRVAAAVLHYLQQAEISLLEGMRELRQSQKAPL